MNTFFSYVFGCRVNEAEKVMLDQALLGKGFIWSEDNPDFYIINSCAVTGKAEREVRQHIYQTRKKFPNTTIIVTGCAATNWINHHIQVNGVDHCIPNNKKQELPTFIASLAHSKYHKISHMRSFVVNSHDKFLSTGRLMVKIQDGCDKFCSYCIVPSLRGKPTSRTIKDIISNITSYEFHKKKRSHVFMELLPIHEVILTAINTACFGKDTGETLIELIDAILKQTTVPTISFGSIHPWSVTNEFLTYYKSIMSTNRFIPFFHVPIQSGSNKILKLMNRGYTKEEILIKLKKIKSINPNAFIGTDIIVGFPGEGEKEFQETYAFLHHAPIDKIHVFRFSPRPGTLAENLRAKFGDVTPEEKRKRSTLLITVSKQKEKKLTT